MITKSYFSRITLDEAIDCVAKSLTVGEYADCLGTNSEELATTDVRCVEPEGLFKPGAHPQESSAIKLGVVG